MRDILIKLIREARKLTKGANCDIERNSIFADYLLENGVIALPCNVGDTVYMIGLDGEIEELEVISCVCVTSQDIKTMTVNCANQHIDLVSFGLPDFGKCVFVTQEEAEKVLRGYEND